MISFADDNLALAVLQSLIHAELVPAPDWPAVRAANPYDRELYWDEVFEDAEPADLEEYDSEAEYFQEVCESRYLNSGVRHDLVGYLEQQSASVALLRALDWVMPTDVVYACWPQWDGESDEFDIVSLSGIEHCPGLTSLHLQNVTAPLDLNPLTGLASLERITIEFAPKVDDWRALLAIPALRTVTAPVDETVAAALRARGVEVSHARSHGASVT